MSVSVVSRVILPVVYPVASAVGDALGWSSAIERGAIAHRWRPRACGIAFLVMRDVGIGGQAVLV